MYYITEEKRRTPVKKDYDVIVAGGGIAGVSSALAAIRNGAENVLLIDRNYGLGGLATLGLITIFLPLCDGRGHQVSFGICEELLKLSIKYGYEKDYPVAWLDKNSSFEQRCAQRYLVQYNANIFSLLAEKLLVNEGVHLLYGTAVTDVVTDGDIVKALIVENKSGRNAYSAKTFVDATGDSDLFFLAGAPTVLSGNANDLAAWYYKFEQSHMSLVMLGVCDRPDEPTEVDSAVNLDEKKYTGVDADDLTVMTVRSHSALLDHYLSNGGIDEKRAMTSIASIPQVRMTRRIQGVVTVGDEEFKHYDDSIGMISNWKVRGPVYEIPFSSLFGSRFANLITAGRSISATDDMWDNTRVIPPCAVTGEAAGTAAAIFTDFRNADVGRLQSVLSCNGVKLHTYEIGL